MKKKKTKRDKGPDLMERTRATVAYIECRDRRSNDRNLELYAFLSLFHPNMSEERKRKLCGGGCT